MTTPAYNEDSSGNVFTRKLGPLPMWAWMGVALLGALLFYLYNKKKTSAGGTSPSTVDTPGGVDASLVPQFVNQTFVNNTPPSAPSPAKAPTPVSKPDSDDTHPTQKVSGTGTFSATPGENFIDVGKLAAGAKDIVVYKQPGNKEVFSKNHFTATSLKIPNLAEGTKYYVKILQNGKWQTKTITTGPS